MLLLLRLFFFRGLAPFARSLSDNVSSAFVGKLVLDCCPFFPEERRSLSRTCPSFPLFPLNRAPPFPREVAGCYTFPSSFLRTCPLFLEKKWLRREDDPRSRDGASSRTGSFLFRARPSFLRRRFGHSSTICPPCTSTTSLDHRSFFCGSLVSWLFLIGDHFCFEPLF